MEQDKGGGRVMNHHPIHRGLPSAPLLPLSPPPDGAFITPALQTDDTMVMACNIMFPLCDKCGNATLAAPPLTQVWTLVAHNPGCLHPAYVQNQGRSARDKHGQNGTKQLTFGINGDLKNQEGPLTQPPLRENITSGSFPTEAQDAPKTCKDKTQV